MRALDSFRRGGRGWRRAPRALAHVQPQPAAERRRRHLPIRYERKPGASPVRAPSTPLRSLAHHPIPALTLCIRLTADPSLLLARTATRAGSRQGRAALRAGVKHARLHGKQEGPGDAHAAHDDLRAARTQAARAGLGSERSPRTRTPLFPSYFPAPHTTTPSPPPLSPAPVSPQIVLRLHESAEQVVRAFDVDCCGFLFDGTNVRCTDRAARALRLKCNFAVAERRSAG